MEYETHSSEETFNLGFEMAQKAHKGASPAPGGGTPAARRRQKARSSAAT